MIKILYPYNEKLPKQTAHDVYIYKNCFSISEQGCEVNLITGRPIIKAPDLHSHYIGKRCRAAHPPSSRFDLKKGHTHEGIFHHYSLPLVRKWGPTRMSWNLPFFALCQELIKKDSPDLVMMSVLKQASYHLQRRVKGVQYVYELHDLSIYPPLKEASYHPEPISIKDLNLSEKQRSRFKMELNVLNQADLITVTTETLKTILQQAPYKILRPIEVVPLGTDFSPLELNHSSNTKQVKLGYVGQLYSTQGVGHLIKALKSVPHCDLEIYGGNETQIIKLKKLCKKYSVENQILFHGFTAPGDLQKKLSNIDVFVAPFELTPHMCYVAHTKLIDYSRLSRPILAPDIQEVRDQVSKYSIPPYLFDPTGYPENLEGLIQTLNKLKDRKALEKQTHAQHSEFSQFPLNFSWEARSELLVDILKNRFSNSQAEKVSR